MTWGRRTLQRRIALLCAWSSIGVIGGFGAAFYELQRHSLSAATVANLETLARMTAANVVAGVEFDAPDNVQLFLQKVAALPDVDSVTVLDSKARVIATSDTLDTAVAPWMRSAFVGRVEMPYLDERGRLLRGSVVVAASGDAVNQQLVRSMMAFTGVGLAAIAALLLIVRPILRRFLLPVHQMVEATRLIGGLGDYSHRVAVTSSDEIGDLVRSFNSMLDAIAERDARLAQNAESLERQIVARTAELSRALEQARQAMQAKSTFLANMSHEIRTPLNAVLGMTDLAMETANPEEQAEYLGIVRSAGTNLLGVLNDILDFSKIDSGKLDLLRVTADVEAVVLEAVRPLTAKLQSKDLEVHLLASPLLVGPHEFDDVRVRQIVTNLVGNAVKFTERGHVLVRIDVPESDGETDTVEISVSDTGVGIQPDRLHAIFSPFTQADNTITRRFSGTGLGLTICDHLARLMGGAITVQSQLGVGSTFVVRVPMRRRAAEDAEPLPNLQGRDIVLYTRSEPLREAMAGFAARLGAAIANTGTWQELEQRLQAAAQSAPLPLVVLDERDPDVDAVVAAHLSPRPEGRRAVLLLTSYQDLAATMQRCTDRAYAGYLLKPLGLREFAVQATSIGQQRAPVSRRAPQDGGRSLRVLVAEDNLVNQRLIQKLLERDGHVTTVVANGRACLEAFRRQTFDLVLMDMQMPEMDGLEATARIRELEAGSGARVPVLALTANTSTEDRAACIGAGMDDVLTKPVSVPKLQATLRRFAGAAAAAGSPDEGKP